MKENPYIGLRPYTFEDREKFFGRDQETLILLDKIVANKLTLLFAASGVGKSSLLRAGVIPKLQEKNHDVVYFFEWADQPEFNLKQAIIKTLKNQQRINDDYQANFNVSLSKFIKIHQFFAEECLVIILDQFEEFFNYTRLKESFLPFVESLAEAMQEHDMTAVFVLSMREDFALELNAFKPFISGVFENFYRLEKLSKNAAKQAILEPLKQVGFKFEENLLENVLEDLSRREQIDRYGLEQALQLKDVPLFVEPPHLQIVCSQLWELEQNQLDKTIHVNVYEKNGKAQGFLKNHFLSKINELNIKEKKLASAAFDLLVNKHGTKMAYPLGDLAQLLRKSEQQLEQTLNKLEHARVLRKTERHGNQDQPILWFELYHDVFAKKAYDWNEQFKATQRRNKYLKMTAIVIGSFAIIGLGTDYYLNAHFQYLRTNPKTNTIELYQGHLNSVDLFGQQRFLAEMPLDREQLESDKRFEKHQLIDNAQLFLDLTGKLPIAKRVQSYFENGEFDLALTLAKDNISTDNEVSQQITEYLVKSRSLESAKLLETIFNDQQTIPPIKERIIDKIKHYSSSKIAFTAFLIKLLNDGDMRSKAINILVKLGVKEAIPQLIELIKDKSINIEIRFKVINALGRLQAKEIIPQLIKSLKDDNIHSKYEKIIASLNGDEPFATVDDAIDTLGVLGAKEAIPQFIELLTDNNKNVRSKAIKALGQLQAKEAIPQLIKFLKDKDMRIDAIKALGQLQAKEAIPQLIELLKNKNIFYDDAIEVLGQLQAKEAIPQLIELIKDKSINITIRFDAIKALGQLQAKEAIPQLIKFLKDKDMRFNAIEVLGQLQAKEAIPQLIELIKDKYVRFSTIEALGQLQAKEAIPLFVELIKDKDEDIRFSAIKILILYKQKEAINELLKLSKHYDMKIKTESTLILRIFNISKTSKQIPILEAINEFMNEESVYTLTTLKKLKRKMALKFDASIGFFNLKDQILNEESTNETKINALWMMGKLETEEAARFIIEHVEEFEVFAIQALGDTKQKVALAFLKDQLKQLEKDKQELHHLRERSDLNEEEKNHFQALQDQSYLETEVAYSIAKLDPINEGLKLLEHPFVEVRNGAIFGIGHFANFNVFKDLLNAFDKTNLNEPIKRFALYRAIDVSLMTLESDAKPEDVEPLNKIKENLPQTTHQHQAIKQRLEWTLNEINYRLKNPDETF